MAELFLVNHSFAQPIGELYILGNAEKILALSYHNDESQSPAMRKKAKIFMQQKHAQKAVKIEDAPTLLQTLVLDLKQFIAKPTIDTYQKISAYPREMHGTDFEKKVWDVIAQIPFGSFLSYKDIAEKIAHPQAVRAVGRATGQNPCSIMVPCHRVLASNLYITGYTGGLEKKIWLLNQEKIKYYIKK